MTKIVREVMSLGVLCLAGSLGGTIGQAQASGGCTLKNQIYTCDRSQFQQTLANAKTVQIEAGARDRMTAAKLRDLTVALGKAVTTAGEPADLLFSLLPLESDGVLIGPAGTELAVLRVYGPVGGPVGANGGRGNLLWAETLFGQPDMSRPAAVQMVIQQFRAGFKQ